MSKKQKLTPWFPAHVDPVRVGVYERQWEESVPLYALWDGHEWKQSYSTPSVAAASIYSTSELSIGWRGLAKEPK